MPSLEDVVVPIAPNSPIFPSASFTSESNIKALENQVSSSGGLSVSIVLAEQVLFLQGFTPEEYNDHPPALLRGSLVVSTSKATRIKAITLTFKGQSTTDWPEGIPPKRTENAETNDLHCHVWSFFNASFPMAEYSSGAHLVRFAKDSPSTDAALNTNRPRSGSNNSLASIRTRSGSNASRHRSSSNDFAAPPERGRSSLSVHQQGDSTTSLNTSLNTTTSSASAIKGLASRLRRAASPNPSSAASLQAFSGIALGPHRSFSKTEAHEQDAHAKGYRVFEPGEYIYNFELAIPQSLPESIKATFGSVAYKLEALIERPGTFKSNISGTRDVKVVRTTSENNLEATEPIAISRDWEDQLHYDIVIGGKCFSIGTAIPIAFKFTPLAKMRCHRIRVYVTENIEYFCKKKKVHRIEPTKKYLMKEYLPNDGIAGSLLNDYSGADLTSATEMEYNVHIPESFNNEKNILHPNTAYENIQVHHWIKLVLRLSKMDPNDASKRKFYEISIDSPITLLDNHCTNANLMLPQYHARRPSLVSNASSSTLPVPMITRTDSAEQARPIHFLRKPSVAPPPFDADEPPPSLDLNGSAPMYRDLPPTYETAMGSPVPSSPEEDTRATLDAFSLGTDGRSVNSVVTTSTGSSSSEDSNATLAGSSTQTSSFDPSFRGSTSSASGARRNNRQVSVVSSVDIVDQRSEFPMDEVREDEEEDEEDPVHALSAGARPSLDSSMHSSATNIQTQLQDMRRPSYGRRGRTPSTASSIISQRRSSSTPSFVRDSYFPAEVYPLLAGQRQSLKAGSELGAMDSSGDLGLSAQSDFDDAASLQSTPSLWIS